MQTNQAAQRVSNLYDGQSIYRVLEHLIALDDMKISLERYYDCLIKIVEDFLKVLNTTQNGLGGEEALSYLI